MGTSEVDYRGKEFSAPDWVLQVWLRLLLDEVDKLDPLPDWLFEARENWQFQATHNLGQGIVLDLDNLLNEDERRRVVLKSAMSALARLRSLGDPIPAATLAALSPQDSPPSTDVEAKVLLESGEDFVDLLDLDEAPPGQRPITSEAEFRRALEAHARWLVAPASGTRLFLRDATLDGVDLRGVHLRRARLIRVDLRGARLAQMKIARSEFDEVNLEAADLSDASFLESKLRRCNLSHANAQGATFANTLAEDCSFQGTNLERVRVERSSFFCANLDGATVTNSHIEAAISGELRGCNFRGSDLRSTRFFDADLRDVDFTETTLVGTGLKRVRLYGARGVPYQADKIASLALDFSPAGDGSAPGTLATFREQLECGAGDQPWGTATMPDRYAAFQVHDGDKPYFILERRSDQTEVVRIRKSAVQQRRLSIEYETLDSHLADSVVQHLIHEVLLGSEPLASEFRGKFDTIEYEKY